jgi:nicotinamide phosphoribosyltransferase
VIDQILPQLKDKIMARNGKLVIRPDSGDPVDILCGADVVNGAALQGSARKGVIERLWEVFGGTVNAKGYRVLDSHIGAIYGDSITLERAENICKRLEAKGFASTNVVLGIGSFTYQYTTRDTYGNAVKATMCLVNGEERQMFKDPKTDDGVKKSARGCIRVTSTEGARPVYLVQDGLTWEEAHGPGSINALREVWKNGVFTTRFTLDEIRNNVSEIA